jgi:hypothetical protein
MNAVTYSGRDGWAGIDTVEAVGEAVDMIAGWAGDPEEAHFAEDSLYLHVLKQIAEGRPADPSAFAREALRAEQLDFPHWYA